MRIYYFQLSLSTATMAINTKHAFEDLQAQSYLVADTNLEAKC